MTRTEDAELRQRMDGLLGSVRPSPAPVEVIIQRGRRIRLRRAGVAAGCLGLAGIVAASALIAARGGGQGSPRLSASGPASAAGPGGVFASGTADGHPWRLAVQDIADPGQRCLPAVTINGTDADPLYPDPGARGGVNLGSADPGVVFAFGQVADGGPSGLLINGTRFSTVTAAACGDHFRLIGFAYRPNDTIRGIMFDPALGRQTVLPGALSPASIGLGGASSQSPGMWDNVDLTRARATSATIASGTVSGYRWSIRLTFGSSGECYAFEGTGSLGSARMGSCGPIGTPGGAATIMALPLGFPDGTGATGYAVELSPGTVCLLATLSDGSTELAFPKVVAGREYAAFVVSDSLRLVGLTWLNSSEQAIAATTAVPRYGYVQFQP